jgi:sigma-E factor negative regulatory protein RseC
MIEQQGKVLSVDGDRAQVRLGGTSGCSACEAGKGCGAGVFGRLLHRRPVVLELENRVQAEPEQPVVVGLPESLFLSLLTRLYLLPLLAGLAGAVTAHLAASGFALGDAATDLATLAGALLAAAAVIYRSRQKVGEFPESFIVHILRIVPVQIHTDGTRGIHCD